MQGYDGWGAREVGRRRRDEGGRTVKDGGKLSVSIGFTDHLRGKSIDSTLPLLQILRGSWVACAPHCSTARSKGGLECT